MEGREHDAWLPKRLRLRHVGFREISRSELNDRVGRIADEEGLRPCAGFNRRRWRGDRLNFQQISSGLPEVSAIL
jgi:hypothetical protein